MVDLGKFPVSGYTYTYALSVSDDGKVVGGWATDATAGKVPNRGWIWTQERGMQPIALRSDLRDMAVHVVSADGRYFAGVATGWNDSYIVWGQTSRPNDYILVPGVQVSYGPDWSPMKISADGSVVLAHFYDKTGSRLRLVNMKTGKQTVLPKPVTGWYYGNGLSADGSRVLTWMGPYKNNYYWRADKPTLMRMINPTGLRSGLQMMAMSDDGLVTAGWGYFQNGWPRSVLWSENKTEFLPLFNGLSLEPSALNRDGTILATFGHGTESMLYMKQKGWRSFRSLLRGSEIPRSDWMPASTPDMSASGLNFLVQANVKDSKGFLVLGNYLLRFKSMQELLSR